MKIFAPKQPDPLSPEKPADAQSTTERPPAPAGLCSRQRNKQLQGSEIAILKRVSASAAEGQAVVPKRCRLWSQALHGPEILERQLCQTALPVPATTFCEPDEGEPAQWHWFALKGNVDRPLFAFAGIYRAWKDPLEKDNDNVDIEVFSVMTTPAKRTHSTINHERSPVLLTEEGKFATWLNAHRSRPWA